MGLFPEHADEMAQAFGIKEKIEEMRAARETGPQSYVYLIDTQTEDAHYYKIGKSVEPHARLKILQSGRGANMPPAWEGQLLRPLALRLGGLSVESSIHVALRSYRIARTEWFIADAAISEYVKAQGDWKTWAGEKPNPSEYVGALEPNSELPGQ